jgi:cold shock protein
VLVKGLGTLTPGQAVEFTFEQFGQDGYPYRAIEAWPLGDEPFRQPPETMPSAAYESTLTLSWEPTQRDGQTSHEA